jgi:hypothetical protein
LPTRFAPYGRIWNKRQPQPALQHICKPTHADTQTKGLQKSCNFSPRPFFIVKFLLTFISKIDLKLFYNESLYIIKTMGYAFYLTKDEIDIIESS